jgi:hypothetical protein
MEPWGTFHCSADQQQWRSVMKRILGVLTILCVFGLTNAAVVQSALTNNESSLVVQDTLMEIDGLFYVIMDSTGKE